jgi:hypothetical protein
LSTGLPAGLWIPAQWPNYATFRGIETNFYCEHWWIQYMFLFYNAILQLTGNDISPQSIESMMIAMLVLLAGALMNANIFGIIANIF